VLVHLSRGEPFVTRCRMIAMESSEDGAGGRDRVAKSIIAKDRVKVVGENIACPVKVFFDMLSSRRFGILCAVEPLGWG